jgi:hypothetical protein
MPTRAALVIAFLILASACGGDESAQQEDAPAGVAATTTPATTTSPSVSTSVATAAPATTEPTTTTVAQPTTTTTVAPSTTTTETPPIAIRIRFERRVDDAATEDFAEIARRALIDPRGWERAGFEFSFDESGAEYAVILAEGAEVDALCDPYTTRGRFSCQIGPIVALNADRWRGAVESWPGSLLEYQTMLVNHEVGHLLGQHHPAESCVEDGDAAAVMAQQSSGVGSCLANPWPLEWEIACAARHDEPLAPPYEADARPTCGPDG